MRVKVGLFNSPSIPLCGIDFQGSCVTSDGGLILVRELDERLGFGELIAQHLTDSRRGKNKQFPFADPAERDNRSTAGWLGTKT